MKLIKMASVTQAIILAGVVGCFAGDQHDGMESSVEADEHSGHAGHSDHSEHGGDSDGDEHSGGDHDDDVDSETVTVWGDRTQLFAEFPSLVLGKSSEMTAYLTRLSDHLPIRQGSVAVELRGGDKPVERFNVDAVSAPGIFRLAMVPSHAGRRQIVLFLDSAEATEEHNLGEFEVFSNEATAHRGPPEEHLAGQISYSLEQQWLVPFQVSEVSARPMRASVPAFAEFVQPGDGEAWVTAPRDGRVEVADGRFPRLGEVVEQGESFFSLTTTPEGGGDTATLDLAVEQSGIRVDAAKREVERLETLVAAGVVPQRRLDEAGSELATAEAELRSARRRRSGLAQAQRVGASGDAVAIPAPLAGEVTELVVAPGAWVAAGDRLAKIVQRDRLVLVVYVPEAYVPRIKEVAGVWFRLAQADLLVEVPRSSLIAVGTEINERRTLSVSFSVSNVGRDLFAGIQVSAKLLVAEPVLALAVPADSLVDDGGADVVYVQTGGESFERRQVRVGLRDGEFLEVLSGLSSGEWVVSRGAPSVKRAATSTAAIGHGHSH